MNLLLKKSEKYKGYSLDIDHINESISIVDRKKNVICKVSLDEIIVNIVDSFDYYINKRKEPRVPLAIKIKYIDEDGKGHEGITSTLGGGGLFIESPAPLHPGSNVQLEFVLPDKEGGDIKAEGRVVWNRPNFERIINFPGMGIQFTNISDREKKNLVKFVNSVKKWRGGYK
ncbi:MAG: PilZ domain-containing protein [Nitrospirota bacterium]